MNNVTFTCPSARMFIYKTFRLISIKFRMADFIISCSGNLILFGNSTIIISMADIYSYTNSAKLWVHHDRQKQRERKRITLQCQ